MSLNITLLSRYLRFILLLPEQKYITDSDTTVSE